MNAKKHVGLVGLGIMGSAIAPNLIAAGYRVTGFDVDAGRCSANQQVGVEIVDSAAAVATATSQILTSLPNEKALGDTVRDLAASPAKNLTIIEMSTMTIDSKVAAEKVLSGAGHIMLDCPLSGTGAQAKTRDLTVYASGNAVAIAACASIFEAFAKAHFDLGVFGNGSKMKYVANLLVFIHNVAAAEALVLGMKAGLDPKQVLDVVKLGAGGSRMLEIRGPAMVAGKFDTVTAGFPMYYKDLGIIGKFAMDLDCPTPLLSASLPIYLAGGGAYPDCDVAAVCGVLEKMAGIQREN